MKEVIKTEYISIRDAVSLTGINAQTLRKLGDEQKIRCYKTLTGQRKFDKHNLEEMCNSTHSTYQINENTIKNFIYARVSCKKQIDDLSRQVEFIQSKQPKYATYEYITDVASSINFKRKGLSNILDASLQGTLGEVVVAHRDRLCRFGFDLLKLIIEKKGGIITVIDDEKHKSSEQELSEDILSIVHMYSSRQMEKRSYKIKTRNKDITNTNTNTNTNSSESSATEDN